MLSFGTVGQAGAKNSPDSTDIAAAAKFPERVGLFKRQGPAKLDVGGNPQATYWAGALVLMDVFYYRTYGHTLEREYSDCKDYVKIVTPDAFLVSDSATTISPGGHTRVGRRAIFRTRKPHGVFHAPLKSQLLIFENKDRFVKYRITYASTHAQKAEEQIGHFLSSFSWPGN